MQVVANYDYYTIDQAREILKEESRIKRQEQRKRELRRRNKAIYYLKQKAMGLVLTIISVIIPMIDGDATVSIFLMPIGLHMIFTKQRVIYR